ncbi:MAG: alginate export family protein [Candidatus Omnitrophota bacterium]|nr:alginate export family protein [Candidatus Omnitrophota bacterium]
MWYKQGQIIIIVSAVLLLAHPLWANEECQTRGEIHDKIHDEHEEKTAQKKGITYNIGAEERVRGDFVTNQNLGDFSYAPDTHDEQILSRTRVNFLLSPIKELKVFAEGQFYMREDNEGDSDYSKGNLYQAYAELSDMEHIPLEAKVGRQQLCYGSGFFLGTNDFYDGLVWDAAKARVLLGDKFWVDGIAARYVNLNKGTSKDRPALYGAYSQYEITEDTTADLYFFYHHGGFEFFHSDLADDATWYTIGTRFAGKIMEQFDYEIEPLYQFGNIENEERGAHDTISAYGGHVEAGYTFKSKYNPRLFAGYAFGSGDNKTDDKYYSEFHGNIYNDQYIVGDISLVPDVSGITVGDFRASGMHIIIGGISMDLHPRINLNIDYHYFLADKTPADISRNIGSEVNVIANFKITENVNLILSANRFFLGRFFKDAVDSRKDINYFYVQTQIKF